MYVLRKKELIFDLNTGGSFGGGYMVNNRVFKYILFFIKIAQEEFDTVGNKMGTRNNEPTENNIHNEHGRKEHNRGPYNGEIKW